jgi:hypothetical protein
LALREAALAKYSGKTIRYHFPGEFPNHMFAASLD